MNEDGKVNLSDAITVQKASIGLASFTAKQVAEADVNSDGEINLSDAIMLQKYSLHLSVNLPIGQEKEIVLK